MLLRAIGAQTATVLVYQTTGELAWLWVRYRPESTLSKWFRGRLAGAKGRMKKILIVAMARKLLACGDMPLTASSQKVPC